MLIGVVSVTKSIRADKKKTHRSMVGDSLLHAYRRFFNITPRFLPACVMPAMCAGSLTVLCVTPNGQILALRGFLMLIRFVNVTKRIMIS